MTLLIKFASLNLRTLFLAFMTKTIPVLLAVRPSDKDCVPDELSSGSSEPSGTPPQAQRLSLLGLHCLVVVRILNRFRESPSPFITGHPQYLIKFSTLCPWYLITLVCL